MSKPEETTIDKNSFDERLTIQPFSDTSKHFLWVRVRNLKGENKAMFLVDKEKLLRSVIDKPVIVQVEGGLISDVYDIPRGINVETRDYDIEGCDEDEEAELSTDKNGDKYYRFVY